MRLAAKITTLFAAFVLAILLVLRFWILPQLQNSGTAAAVLRIAQASIRFQKDHGNPPGYLAADPKKTPAPKNIVAALRGQNPSAKNYLDDFPDEVIRDGVIVDSFGRPFRYSLDTNGFLTVTSAGSDGRFGNADDISSRSGSETGVIPGAN